jgi:hypothetical protein
LTSLVRKLRKRGADCSPARWRSRRRINHGLADTASGFEPSRRSWQTGRGAVLELVGGRAEIVDEWEESERKVRTALERNRALGSGLRVGKCFEVEAADGAAWYELTRIGANSVEVEWRDYGRDRCMDEMFGAGGEFSRPLIERLARRHDLLQELFEALA